MQQPMNQQEQIGGQQVTQQMVLCPVRFVYETQVLVQPGDQIHPNQTFFINHQNPPPWMQNRSAPNPVVYVQQLPNNMVPSVQQHVDQNQLYLQQNFANFQLQQHMLAQNQQEIRPTMQLANIMPNMVQNVQQHMQTNERNINQNAITGQIQAQNTQNAIQNQINAANARQNPNQQAMNQAVEVQRPVFMNMRPQMGQQVNITRPIMSLNQIQNMQALTNMPNVQIQQANVGQTYLQNIAQRPIAQNVNTVRPQTMVSNIMNVQPVAKIREIAPTEVNKTVNSNIATAAPSVKNFAQNYNCRPIQPRRRYVPINANMPKVQTHSVPVQTVQHIPIQTPPTQYTHDKSGSHQVVTNIAANTTYLNNPNVNRKRKSASPDEIQTKMAAHPTPRPNYNNCPQQSIIITKLCNEVGTNTSPVHKPNINLANATYQMNPNPQMVIVENAPQVTENLVKNSIETKSITITPLPNENDKQIRNTVYTQARGRLLQDKISDNVVPQVTENTVSVTCAVQNTTGTTTKTEEQAEKPNMMDEEKTEKVNMPSEVQMESAPMITEVQTHKPIIITEVQTEAIKNKEPVNPESKSEVTEKTEVEMSVDTAIKEEPVNKVDEQVSKVKDEKLEADDKIVAKQDILTHVVDGYVIQESNFAFPIRKPLKEKAMFTNPKAEESETPDALKECMKEEMKNTSSADIPLLPFHYLLLNCDKKDNEEMKIEEDDREKSNPFAKLQHPTVKSWTVGDLSNHLLKYDWKDTVSVLQDHEIDGESLYLVTKSQLTNIGVSEEHADVICVFVRS